MKYLPRVLCLFVAGSLVVLAGCAAERGLSVEPDPLVSSPVDAEAQLRQAVEAAPRDPEPHQLLARVLAEQGKAAEAATHYDMAVSLEPGRARKVEKEREEYARTFQTRAAEHLVNGDTRSADTELARADAMVLDHDETLYLRGRVLETNGDMEGALDQYRRAWNADRNDDREDAYVRALVSAGQHHYNAERYPDALALLEEAKGVERSADLEYLRGTVAYTWAQNSQGEERTELLTIAADAFAAVIDKNDDDEDASFNLGAVLLALGRFTEAGDIYTRLIGRNAEQGDLYLALARAQSLAGDNAGAATAEAIGRALRAGQPVDDPDTWAVRAAERFPRTELASVYRDYYSPQAIRTYTLPGGDLVEVWFYWDEGLVEAFREGGRVGPTFYLGG